MNAVDTNVLVYAVDESEPTKQAQAIGLLEKLSAQSVPLVVLWQVAVEFIVCLRRWESAGRLTWEDTLAYKSELLDPLPIIMPSPAILQVSMDLGRRYSLSHWDSLVIAACLDAGIESLYSEDMDSGTDYNGVHVIDPFA